MVWHNDGRHHYLFMAYLFMASQVVPFFCICICYLCRDVGERAQLFKGTFSRSLQLQCHKPSDEGTEKISFLFRKIRTAIFIGRDVVTLDLLICSGYLHQSIVLPTHCQKVGRRHLNNSSRTFDVYHINYTWWCTDTLGLCSLNNRVIIWRQVMGLLQGRRRRSCSRCDDIANE